jgi:hypothetical protein
MPQEGPRAEVGSCVARAEEEVSDEAMQTVNPAQAFEKTFNFFGLFFS